MQALIESLRHLVVANRILAHEGVVDAYGHVSVRHPDSPDRFLLARSRSPELVTMEDVLEFGLDGEPIDPDGPPPYAERYIHAAIFEARPDVQSVIHNHAQELIPFSVTGVPLRPMFNTAGRIGAEVPSWDIRDKFGDTKPAADRDSRTSQLSNLVRKKEDPFKEQDSAWYKIEDENLDRLIFKYNLANLEGRHKAEPADEPEPE